jgi:hypothetical protein
MDKVAGPISGSITTRNLLWDVFDPKEMRREGSFAENAIEFRIGGDQPGLKRYCGSEIETVIDGSILTTCDFQR